MRKKVSSKYSVIIPTLWKSNEIKKNVRKLSKVKMVGEIIIISNSKNKGSILEEVKDIEKTRIIHNGKNNYVNESWNIGYEEAIFENLCISNDDITFDQQDTFEFLGNVRLKEMGIIGAPKLNSVSNDNIELAECGKMPTDFGCLFFIHKSNYTRIPDPIDIWFGDVWLFENCSDSYILKNINISGEKSTTSDSFRSDVWPSDMWAWKRKVKPSLQSNNLIELYYRKLVANIHFLRYKIGLGKMLKSLLNK